MGHVVAVADRLADFRSLRTRLSRPSSAAPLLGSTGVDRAQICRAAEDDDTRRGLATFGPRFGFNRASLAALAMAGIGLLVRCSLDREQRHQRSDVRILVSSNA